jgi:curved DNA-binding protein CbpA
MDFYEVLGIAKTATSAEVRQAYVRLARDRHPDRFQDPAEKQKAQEFFKHLTEAFNTLSNDRNRQQYDEEQSKPKLTAPAEIAADAYARALQKAEEQDFQEAMELLRSAVHHAPEVPAYHVALARILAKNPHWRREAIEELDQALRLNPKDAGAHLEMARLLAAQGLRLRALRSAEAALRLAPSNAQIQKLVNELGGGDAASGPEPDGRGPGGLLDRFRRKT